MESNSSYIKINLSSYLIEEDLIKSIPGALVKKYLFMPVFKIGDTLTIATSEPDNLEMIDEIRRKLDVNIDALFAELKDIKEAITQHYGMMDLIETFVTKATTDQVKDNDFSQTNFEDISTENLTDSSIVNLVNLIISQAILKRASDIHIEPMEKNILIRLRIDGELHEMKRMPKNILSPIVTRIKVISGMDIAESRIPQDGHIKMTIDNTKIELRTSALPMIHGENIVMRLLPKGDIQFGLEQLGLSKSMLAQFHNLINSPFGIFLVTGPTGSGKTTTLYAALNEVNTTSKNIITLEDPVEHQLSLIRQVQVNPKAGLTFNTGLRSILRQDPDIIMVGEIRDYETIELAIRSALTGHMVFSTLHTNDAPSAIVRMIEMGVEPFLVSSATIGVLAQRLVRCICKKCKTEYTPEKEIIELLKLDPTKKYYKGKGCKACGKSGYSGRIGVFELFLLNDDIKRVITKDSSASKLREIAVANGMQTIYKDGLEKIYAGITTPEELMKVVQHLSL
jgi:type IV pilus assembly protein PilB